MSYIDHINEKIDDLDKQVKRLNKLKAQLRKEKQRVCHHQNVTRYAKIPKLSYAVAIDQYTAFDTVKVKMKCNNCGKVLY